jgi:radical SAM/Cys-rich protein
LAPCRTAPAPSAAPVEPFAEDLSRRGLTLVRGKTSALQINTGYLCDLTCRHCHLEAGPQRREVMTGRTMDDVAAFASRVPFASIDITGGAPELVPGIGAFLTRLAPLTRKLIMRTNLVAFREPAAAGLMEICRDLGVALVASFPSTHTAQAEAVRGRGFGEKSLAVLRELQRMGYGAAGSGLTLDMVVNPAGAFLPPNQDALEKRFKLHLNRQGIAFNHLFSFANAPLGRFRTWLEGSGNIFPYIKLLSDRFNPDTLDWLMCRSQISVAWDGALYDCDFNIAAGLPHGGRPVHVSALAGPPEENSAIMTGLHCYACTAGAGFT